MTKYDILTPYGVACAQWAEDESAPVEYSGKQSAIDYFADYLDMTVQTGRFGRLLSAENVQPVDLLTLIEADRYGISVMPDAETTISMTSELYDRTLSDLTKTA
ncbi:MULTISPECIES: hypothetical protein [Pseudomonas]|uniref:Uncharacterized protein n=1 Tax=Pseudomonas lutea TaxID=243924 RepID=A0A9X8QLP6_9PSED|nr:MULTISPECIES: hypothetical protein [Pseudomonas]SER35516.1 hypothetical protein SAMN05216409_11814 [Pseudomonas lutea]